jgi:hypothetical protein
MDNSDNSKPDENQGRKATGLRHLCYDSQVAKEDAKFQLCTFWCAVFFCEIHCFITVKITKIVGVKCNPIFYKLAIV